MVVPETAEIMPLLEDTGIYIYIHACLCIYVWHICLRGMAHDYDGLLWYFDSGKASRANVGFLVNLSIVQSHPRLSYVILPTHQCAHVLIYIYIDVYAKTHTHTCVHIYIYMHVHMHLHLGFDATTH